MSSADQSLVVCPSCAAVNRIPAARLADRPRCGSCHDPLFRGEPVVLNDANFAAHFERNDLPLLIDFWAPWCGPCRMMAPAFAQAAASLEPQVRLAKLDTEAFPNLAGRFGIRSIPTMVLARGGRELARQSGALSATQIEQWVRSVLAG